MFFKNCIDSYFLLFFFVSAKLTDVAPTSSLRSTTRTSTVSTLSQIDLQLHNGKYNFSLIIIN
jgi:hypothetical protein